jgi:hypothetical protein
MHIGKKEMEMIFQASCEDAVHACKARARKQERNKG